MTVIQRNAIMVFSLIMLSAGCKTVNKSKSATKSNETSNTVPKDEIDKTLTSLEKHAEQVNDLALGVPDMDEKGIVIPKDLTNAVGKEILTMARLTSRINSQPISNSLEKLGENFGISESVHQEIAANSGPTYSDISSLGSESESSQGYALEGRDPDWVLRINRTLDDIERKMAQRGNNRGSSSNSPSYNSGNGYGNNGGNYSGSSSNSPSYNSGNGYGNNGNSGNNLGVGVTWNMVTQAIEWHKKNFKDYIAMRAPNNPNVTRVDSCKGSGANANPPWTPTMQNYYCTIPGLVNEPIKDIRACFTGVASNCTGSLPTPRQMNAVKNCYRDAYTQCHFLIKTLKEDDIFYSVMVYRDF